jgi:hypothetical protein
VLLILITIYFFSLRILYVLRIRDIVADENLYFSYSGGSGLRRRAAAVVAKLNPAAQPYLLAPARESPRTPIFRSRRRTPIDPAPAAPSVRAPSTRSRQPAGRPPYLIRARGHPSPSAPRPPPRSGTPATLAPVRLGPPPRSGTPAWPSLRRAPGPASTTAPTPPRCARDAEPGRPQGHVLAMLRALHGEMRSA